MRDDAMTPLRVGIVGAGFGAKVHAPAYNLHPRFEVVALASPNRAEKIAAERKIPHAFASVEAMLAGVELDVVSVASPPFDHYRSVLAALRAGKHVLCEKPFALSVAEAEEMVAEAARGGTATALAFEYRYAPGVRALLELVENGHVGALREIEVVRMMPLLQERATIPRGWFFDAAKGGGVANGMMPHQFDMANVLAGRGPLSTSGFCRVANPRRTDKNGTFEATAGDGAFAHVDYGDGIVARVSCDATTVVDSTTVALHGERRSAIANGAHYGALNLYTLAEDEQDELELKPAPYEKHATIHQNLPHFLVLLDRFAELIDEGAPGAPTFADGLTVQRQLRAIGYGT